MQPPDDNLQVILMNSSLSRTDMQKQSPIDSLPVYLLAAPLSKMQSPRRSPSCGADLKSDVTLCF
jgi:hypothetical protein